MVNDYIQQIPNNQESVFFAPTDKQEIRTLIWSHEKEQ